MYLEVFLYSQLELGDGGKSLKKSIALGVLKVLEFFYYLLLLNVVKC